MARVPARAVMVCGTSSGAGKSLVATALARWYARQGYRVAPFKAQNMSNNARVVAGGEIGSAQYFQALAARVVPDVRMNPVLLKPETDVSSQLVLLGRPNIELSRLSWRERARHLWPVIAESLRALRADFDVVVIEGAGSPAEINLQADDIVNMRVAEEAAAATLVVADIDRGGAFAHLYGTHQLLPIHQRRLIRGFLLNKFRGDAALLTPGPEELEVLTGVPTLGVLPMWRGHGLPEEDGVYDAASSGGSFRVVVVAYPRISNADEFTVLGSLPGVSLIWARTPAALAGADLIILPGSKHVAADLGWLRATGIDEIIGNRVRTNGPLLAICGGLQMLGTCLIDPHGVEGAGAALGLLPFATEYAAAKRTAEFHGAFGLLSGFWAPLSGIDVSGYEIRYGFTVADSSTTAPLAPVLGSGAGWQQGNVLAVYVHGLFENAAVVRALFGHDMPCLDDTLDGLADFLERHVPADRLRSLLT